VNDARIEWGPLPPEQIAEMYDDECRTAGRVFRLRSKTIVEVNSTNPLRFTVVYAAPTEELAEQAWEALSVKGSDDSVKCNIT